MSKNINVNPGQYKTQGRERQGEDVVHQDSKQNLARNRKEVVSKRKNRKKR